MPGFPGVWWGEGGTWPTRRAPNLWQTEMIGRLAADRRDWVQGHGNTKMRTEERLAG